jgi:HK97 family phage portal protein
MLYGGPDQSGKPALLPPGLTWQAVGYTSVEAQLVDQRKVAREEIAGVYLISPPLLGIMDSATYSNIDTLRESIYTDTLGPPFVMIEQDINGQIIRDLLGEEDDIFVEFDFSQVLRGDRLQQITSLRAAIGMGMMTPNEGRDVLTMPRSLIEGMDAFYLPTNNLGPVGQLHKEETITETGPIPGDPEEDQPPDDPGDDGEPPEPTGPVPAK